jgi:AraC-like DNA-binding protein
MAVEIPQRFRERLPTRALHEHVALVWVRDVSSRASIYTDRSVPNGSVELSAAIGSNPMVTGQHTGPVVTTLTPGTHMVGVRFRPGAASAVLGVPAPELVDLRVGLDDVWGASATVLAERLAEAATPKAAAALLEAEVLQRAGRPDPLVAEAVKALHPRQPRAVSALGGELWMSDRQLRRRIVSSLGFGPKMYQRIVRFQLFIALATMRSGNRDLARLASDAGFADQSHLTRESARLSGLSPVRLLDSIDEACGPSHDHRASRRSLLRGQDSAGRIDLDSVT